MVQKMSASLAAALLVDGLKFNQRQAFSASCPVLHKEKIVRDMMDAAFRYPRWHPLFKALKKAAEDYKNSK